MKILIISTEYPTKDSPNAVPFLKRQVDHLLKSGVDVDVYHFIGRKNPINYFKAWKNLRKLTIKNKYDIIHSHFGQSAMVALPKKLPLIVTFHGSDLIGIPKPNGEYSFIGKLLQFISRQISLEADRVICVSKKLTNYLPKNINYEVIPCGIDLDQFKPIEKDLAKEQLGIPKDHKVIFFPGNPNRPVKNFKLAQEAVSLLNYDSVKLIPAIDIPHSQINLFYNASDVVLFTSLHEGSPTVIKEAQACNVPIVSTDVGDVKERFNGISGNYIVSYDPKEIAAVLQNILASPNRTNSRDYLYEITEAAINDKLIRLYKSVHLTGSNYRR
ncbi:MAG: glycosyltransferase [Saprospiraceae bacterium]|nr:glycosyltransferase [Saprospiraceae bacterium]